MADLVTIPMSKLKDSLQSVDLASIELMLDRYPFLHQFSSDREFEVDEDDDGFRKATGQPELFVLNRQNQSVRIEVYPYDTADDVKMRIQQRVGIPPEEQQLVIHDERFMGRRPAPRGRDPGCFIS